MTNAQRKARWHQHESHTLISRKNDKLFSSAEVELSQRMNKILNFIDELKMSKHTLMLKLIQPIVKIC